MFGKNNSGDLEFKLLDDQRFIIEENQNQMKVLQKGMWGSKDEPIDPFKCKYEVRTMFIDKNGNEVMGKGCSMTEEGVNELTRILVEQGMGNTKDLLEAMSTREDFLQSVKHLLKDTPAAQGLDLDLESIDDDYFSPTTIFVDAEVKEDKSDE